MAEKSLLEQAFAETGVQLDRIIDAYERKQPPHPETIVWYQNGTISSFNITGTLGSSSIPNKNNITEIDIGNSVTKIGNDAFYYSTSLSNIIIPESVTAIGQGAFESCESLKNVIIPNSVLSIEPMAFNFCSSLSSITLGNSLTSLGGQCFAFCNSLSNIDIPNSLSNIWFDAFTSYSGTITFKEKTTTEVQAMENFRWSVGTNKIVCTDGTL